MKTSTLSSWILTFLITIFALSISAQNSIQEKMGYSKDDVLLILHADDLGVGHSVNMATMAAFESKSITSSSTMVPTPWFSEWADMVKNNPSIDVGIHITLTAEWKFYRWDGVLPSSDISTLINEEGYFYDNSNAVATRADLAEVEQEVRAQIDRALEFGINVSHLDSHMGSLFMSPELLAIYIKLGKEYGVPVMLPREAIESNESLKKLAGPDVVLIEKVLGLGGDPAPKTWEQAYIDMLDQLSPGLNEIIIHLGYDDQELQGMMVDHPAFGATWRQNDFNSMTSAAFQKAIKDKKIHLVSWGDVKKAMH